jgi:transcription elongation factor Elf1
MDAALLVLNNQKTKKMNCPNCNKKLTCGCQKKVASDGKQVCSGCLTAYEANVKIAKLQQTNDPKFTYG